MLVGVEQAAGGRLEMMTTTGTTAENEVNLHPWSAAGRGKVDVPSLEAWVEARLTEHRRQIELLVAVEGPRTVENTLRLYDNALAELATAGQQAALLNSVHPAKEIRDSAQDQAQKISETATYLSLNHEVYQALSDLALNEVALGGMDTATRHYLDRTLLQYRLAGVDRDEAARKRIRELHDKATLLSLTFARNVQEGANHVKVRDEAELEGLPPDFLTSHPAGEDGSITLSTDYPDYMPVMTFAKNDELRGRMFLAYNTRAYPANKQVLLDLLKTRAEIATILGYPTWADLATADQMMESAARMKAFLDDLEVASRAGALRDVARVLEFARQQRPGLEAIDAASRGYWYEQYRRSAYDFDSQSVRPYFPYERVEKGILDAAARLFHVTFERAVDADVWDPSVSAWNVFDGGRLVGRFYLDMHPREGKDKWFSAHPLVPGVAGRQIPEAALVCNFPGGKADDPGLMQYDNVTTFFHEFGHLMHALLGGQQPFAGISGIATEGDFVEVPSQMLEEFFRDADLLAGFARHYQTDEPIPAALVERMNQASAFGRSDGVRAQLFYTSYSLDTHNQDPETLDLDALLHDDYTRFLPYTWIDGNRMYASFTHLTGYSSNYYTYLFDKVIALDFFGQFDPQNLLDGETAMRYRRTVLEPGGSKPGNQIVQDFLGRAQSFAAFQSWVSGE
jgi:thimet oligopeptidase